MLQSSLSAGNNSIGTVRFRGLRTECTQRQYQYQCKDMQSRIILPFGLRTTLGLRIIALPPR
jgi:hypothetical protein